MRKLITRSVLAIVAVAAFSSTAFAANIPIGTLQWTVVEYNLQTGDPVQGTFNIVNQTGANSTADFPVQTGLTFNDLVIAVTWDGGANSNIEQADMTETLGGSFDSALIPLPPLPVQATLSGTVTPVSNVLIGGNLWNITGGGAIFLLDDSALPFVESPLGDGVNPLGDGDFRNIYVTAERATGVPEPGTMLLFGVGITGMIARRRLTAKR